MGTVDVIQLRTGNKDEASMKRYEQVNDPTSTTTMSNLTGTVTFERLPKIIYGTAWQVAQSKRLKKERKNLMCQEGRFYDEPRRLSRFTGLSRNRHR